MLTVIKVLNARLTTPFKLEIDFSDCTHGVFDAKACRKPSASACGPRRPTHF
jgi:hypothetical protein